MENINLNILNRMLKNYRTTEITKAEGYSFTLKMDNQYILLDYLNRFIHTYQYQNIEYQCVILDQHALDRWNKRVGPVIGIDKLQIIMNIIFLRQSHRILFLKNGIGIIDNDIVFTYENRGLKLVITTFYGRKNIQPSLNQINNLRKYNLYNNEYINLSLSLDSLNEQVLPPIPKQCIHFNGRNTNYILESYVIKNHIHPYFICYQKNKNYVVPYKITGIDLESPNQELLSNNVLYILHRCGYSEFVYNHLKYHKSEKMAKTHAKIIKNQLKYDEVFKS